MKHLIQQRINHYKNCRQECEDWSNQQTVFTIKILELEWVLNLMEQKL